MLIRGFSKTISVNKTFIILAVIICIISIFFSFSNSYSADQEGPYKYKPGNLIIKLKTDTMSAAVKKLNKKHGASKVKQLFKEVKIEKLNQLNKLKRAKIEKLNQLKKDIGLTRIYIIKVPKKKNIEKIVSEYNQLPDIEYAEPDYIVEEGIIPNDTYFTNNQWNLNNTGQTGGTIDSDIDAPEGWDSSTGNSSVIIAIVDSGTQLNHPDLSGKIIAGWDFVNDDNDPSDDRGHGTHVTGIAAANSNNAVGIAGVCWNCSIMPVKVLDNTGSGSWSDIAQGIIYATDNGANIVNLSLGGYSTSTTLTQSVTYAYNAGVVLVACTHNDGQEYIRYPALYKEVIAVGSTDNNDVRASSSNYGYAIDVVAPGVNIYSTYRYSNYVYLSGTSMATPHVAGLAGLILSINPSYNPDQVKWHIEIGADDQIGNSSEDTVGWDKYYGWGRINVYNSLQTISPGITFSIESTYANWYNKSINGTSGTISTIFTYKAIYFDDNNLPPSNMQVCIDETCNDMLLDTATTIERLRDGNYLNGEQYKYSTTLPLGIHNYYFNASNGTNNRTLPSIGVFNGPTVSDNIAPTGSILINNGANATNLTAVALTLSCTDTGGSDCAQMQFSNDNVTWSDPEDFATTKNWDISSGDGTKTVYVKYKDGAENWSNYYFDTIIFDTTYPVTTASPEGGSYTTGKSITLTCNDGSGSGCDKIYYTTNGETPTTASSVYVSPINIASSATLKFFAKDLAGNDEPVNTEVYTIIIDTSPPSGSININSGASHTNSLSVFLSLSCSDTSGCSQVCISNSSSCSSWEAYVASKSWTLISGDGTKTVYARFRDGAGNSNTSPYSDSILLDTTAPTTTASPSGGTYSSAQNITLICNDASGSGCQTVYYCTGSGCTPATVYSGAINIASSTVLRFYSKDNANNSESVKTVTYTVSTSETIPPTTTASPAGGTFTSAQSVTLTCNDSGSGCQITRFCLGSGCSPSTTYTGAINISNSNTLRFYSTDNDNNNESVKSESYVINLPGQNERVDLDNNIYIIFSQVSDLCNSSSSLLTDSPGSPPSGYTFIGNVYDITTCATYTGTIDVSIPYNESLVSGKENNLKIFHWENGAWKNVTVSVNTSNNTITGRVSSLSPFGLGYSTFSGGSSGSGGYSSGYSTGANENMIALIAILAIISGVFIIRRKRRFNKT